MMEGKYVQAFPEFGPERIGAPIRGFTRISDKPIEIHSQVYTPDIVVVLDSTVIKTVNVTDGLTNGGKIIINSRKESMEMKNELGLRNASVYTVDGTRIALDVLGKPVANTAMLGALLKVSPLTSLDNLIRAMLERFPGPLGEKNERAMRIAYEEVKG
jgi:pyruvate ferredoxin oxidoreductase gamma subunit